jgi:protocatechuate 3,4-dioxygenase beta subunit
MNNVIPFSQRDNPPSPTVPGDGGPIPDLTRIDKNSDLTFVNGRPEAAIGTVLYVFGRVVEAQGAPVPAARVEVWQACYSGKYMHPDDRSAYPLDLHFQYWGVATTGDDGQYALKTILPGAYRAAGGGVRPPHIHFTVKKAGLPTISTDLYFDGTEFHFEGKTYDAATLRQWNVEDRELLALSPLEREQRVARVRLAAPEMGLDDGARYCRFDIAVSSAS